MKIDRSRVRVLIVDDHPMFRLGMAMAFRSLGYGDVTVAESASAAVRSMCSDDGPQIVVLDLVMPELNGIEIVRLVDQQCPGRLGHMVVVLVTTYLEPAVVRTALEAGFSAALGKETEPEELSNVVDNLLMGKSAPAQSIPEVPDLSEREMEVVVLFAQGASVKDVAHALGIATDTVKAHASSIYSKLGVHDRVSAVMEAQRIGLLRLKIR